MELERGSGVLLHPTSLPGPHGSGDFGPEGERFLRWLSEAGQRYWQTLPLGPVGYGHSPYSALSAFALSPLLASPERLVAAGLLEPDELDPHLPAEGPVDFERSASRRLELLSRATSRFDERASGEDRARFVAFQESERGWLADWALFATLREQHGFRPWTDWPAPLAQHADDALRNARQSLAPRVREHEIVQFLVRGHWDALRAQARDLGISIIGDVPIFVAHDSADVWANPSVFHLDAAGHPTVVAGVPPDFFSTTGQRWGNPLYRWERLEEEGFGWWVERFRATFSQVDIVRVDHFRGFAAYWEIPASEETAVNGRWVQAPGEALFKAVREALGDVPIIAEDLGIITPDVRELRDRLGFPGMCILEFAFDSGPHNAYLPHNHGANSVVYTGTHDNDTVVGWWASIPEAMRHAVRRYCHADLAEPHWELIRLAQSSVARLAIAPLQDVLGLGTEARMNVPGRPDGNWGWRFQADALTAEHAARLRDLASLYGRLS